MILKESVEHETEFFLDLKETIDFALQCTFESVKNSITVLDKKYESSEQLADKLKIKQFSDNIYFSFDYSSDAKIDLYFGIYIITTISCLYQRLMIGKGYFVRGGIANGLNMVDKNFIFSTALIKAVETEKETIFPRITMHKELRDLYIEGRDNPFHSLTQGQLVEDWAEQVFLNPFYNHNQRLEKEITLIPQTDLADLIKIKTKRQQRLISKINNQFLDYFDEKKFNSIARKKITERVRRYKNKQQSIYEKYLWARNLLNWVDGKPTDISFKFV